MGFMAWLPSEVPQLSVRRRADSARLFDRSEQDYGRIDDHMGREPGA